jgi:hypothetical protein
MGGTNVMEAMVLDWLDDKGIARWTLVVLVLTLIVAAIYALYAARQVREMIEQKRISILPKMLAYVELHSRINTIVRVINVGNGTAVAVAIEDIKGKSRDGKVVELTFERLLYLKTDAQQGAASSVMHMLVDGRDIRDSEEMGERFPWASMPEIAPGELELVVRFEDIDGNRYAQEIGLVRSSNGYGVCRAKKARRLRGRSVEW